MTVPTPTITPSPRPQTPADGVTIPVNGSPLPVPSPAPVPQTPEDQHNLGGEIVGGPGVAPPATLPGIAAEMGRVEQKLAKLLSRPAGGEVGPGILDSLKDAILDFLREALLSTDGAGSYELDSPCEVDSNGDRLPPRLAEWGLTIGLERNILKRVDALAELIQHHKDLKQPNCTPRRAEGQPVTVTFQEVPED